MAEKLKGGQRPTDDVGQKIFALFYGEGGVGKTTITLTFPSPIWMVNMDRDVGELTAKLPEHYDIEYERIHYDVDMTPAIAESVLAKVDAHARKAIAAAKKGEAASFIFDGFDLLYEYVKVAKLPHSSGDRNVAREYGDVNAWMNGFLSRLYFSPLQVALTALPREVWNKESSGTGTFKPKGFQDKERWMTHEVLVFIPEDTTPKAKPLSSPAVGQSHRAYFRVSKMNEQLVRTIVPNLSYKTLFKLTYNVLPEGADKLWTPTSSSSPTTTSQPPSTGS